MEKIAEIINIKNNGTVAIAIGGSRKTTHWKNKNMQWSDLVEKLSHTTRTPETMAEYKKSTKADRDRIKDVGGFVGGSLKEGRRLAQNVANRSMLTLDLDFVSGDIWTSIQMLYDFSVCMYSTHTHTSENPRLRMVIPLSRPVLPDEYQAIARMVADDLGIDQFDDTTYEPSRLMYWPSTPSDGEYVFKVQDLDWLDPDVVLARYKFGWQDVSYWPESSRARATIKNTLDKQEDPTEKKGIIGAFCRTYTITEAIAKFIPNIYLGMEDGERYTYAEGSTSGGIVVYEDKFTYSHHGTDPTSGMLCNAFDLIRIHKFGDLDINTREDTAINKMPSFLKMSELASSDENVLVTIGSEKMSQATEDFEKTEDVDWLKELEYTDQGKLKSTINNISLIIENEPMLKNTIGFNEFSNRANVLGQLPWRAKGDKQDWTDTDDSGIREFIEKYYAISSPTKCADALALAFERHRYHPIKDYLNSLVWDGTERVNKLFIDYLGADDNKYSETVARKILVAAVARIFMPGCKFDNMPVLSGPQGLGKSTLIRKLGKDWYSDSLTTVTGKEAFEQLQGVWLLEMGEMMATRKADIEATKQFLSKSEDIYRVAYGRRTSRFPRQCVFIGTTNDKEFLRDRTGNRRFWPIGVASKIPNKDVFKLDDKEIDQIWAEAVIMLRQGEKLYLTAEESEQAQVQQKVYSEESAKTGMVEAYLDKKLPEEWQGMGLPERRNYIQGTEFGEGMRGVVSRDKVCVMSVWCELFNGDPGKLTPIASREINDILKGIETWEKSTSALKFRDYGRQRAYTRKKV